MIIETCKTLQSKIQTNNNSHCYNTPDEALLFGQLRDD